ncbi:MAG: class I SAM-dependent methyltransferase [Thermodesulfobacteriota bacterium]
MPGPGLNRTERPRRKNAFDAGLVLGVDRFNKDTGRDRHRSDAPGWLMDQATGLIRDEYARRRSCPVCGGQWLQPLFIKAGFPHGRCPECGLIYVNPVLTEEAAKRYYQEESSWVQVLTSGAQIEMDRLKYAYGLDVAAPYFSGPRVLDVGAGTGLFVETAAARGLQPTALELNRANVDRLRAGGFEVIDRPLEETRIEADTFDLVSLWEVIEHIVEPKPLLNHIARVLKPDGLLMILAPNADSLVTRILHEKSGTFGGHSHVNHFNLKTLTRLLAETGFSLLEAETLITELGTINNHLSFEDPYLGRASEVLDILTPELIHDRLLGSKLFVLAVNKKGRG